MLYARAQSFSPRPQTPEYSDKPKHGRQNRGFRVGQDSWTKT